MLPFIDEKQFNPKQGWDADRNSGKIHQDWNHTAHLVSKRRASVEKQSLEEIPALSLASLHQEVYMSTQCVPVQLHSSQY